MGLFDSIGKAISGSFGSLIGAGAGLLGTSSSNKYAKEEAERNRQFQQYNSDTAYQRAVVDLRKAGLNPILALGSPATTPGGSTASISDLGASMTAGANTGIAYKRAAAEARNVNAIASVSNIRKKLYDDAFDAYKNAPDSVKSAIQAGIIGKEANIRGEIAGGLGGASSLLSKAAGAVKDLVLPAKKGKVDIDKAMKEYLKKTYPPERKLKYRDGRKRFDDLPSKVEKWFNDRYDLR